VGCIPKKLMVMATDYGMAADDARGFATSKARLWRLVGFAQ
jgi:hypothetical protein